MKTSDKKKEWSKQYYQKNKEKIKQKNEKLKKEKSEKNKEYYIKNREKIKEHNEKYYIENCDKLKTNARNYYIQNKSQCINNFKIYRENNKELLIEQRKTWYYKNIDKVRNQKFLKHYGISLDEYNTIFNQQDGKCKICGTHQDDLGKKLVIDHDHCTGKIRGLLCGKCNSILGFVNDDIETLQRAIDYLKNNL